MDGRSFDGPDQDVGLESLGESTPAPFRGGEPPSWRILAMVALAVGVLVAVFALGQAAGRQPEQAVTPVGRLDLPTTDSDDAVPPGSTAAPTTAEAPPTPALVDMLGQGMVLAEIDFGNRSRAIIWCRETVPGTSIGSTLALLHLGDSIRFGEQLIGYQELTRPAIPGANARRGTVLETEGLGAGDFPAPNADEDPDTSSLSVSDGSNCARCAPERIELGGSEALIGSCVHGVPLGVGIVYAIMGPSHPGQTPLALHATCGITTIRHQGDRLVIEAEAPVARGLYDARFPLPPMSLVREDGWFRAEDLELLDWHCEIQRSSQLQERHRLRTEPERFVTYSTIDSLIGEVGVHGPVAIGLSSDQCSRMTRAWWGRPAADLGTGRPIADLLGVDPPPGEDDWYYICQRR